MKLIPWLVSAVLHCIALLPLSFVQLIGRQIGRLNFLFSTRSAKVTYENLALCFPDLNHSELNTLSRESLVETGQTVMETPAVWLSSLSRARGWIASIENEELLDEAIKNQKGVIVLLPHLGNWEMFNVYFATRGKMTALYQPPRQDYLKNIMQEIREKVGNELVPTNIKGLARLFRCLQQGKVVTILPDQVPTTGKYSTFFGHQALTDILVSRLIKRTGAEAICCTVQRRKGRFVIRFSKADERINSRDIIESLDGLNATVQSAVEHCVEQYQWEYKRFRERPTGMKKLYKFTDRPDVFH